MAYGQHDDDQGGGQAASWLTWRLIAWLGVGTFFLLLLGFALFAAVAVYLGGGMPGLNGAPQIGTAASRPTLWLTDPAIVHSTLPNVVILAVMEHESTGQVFDRNYNCSVAHLTSPIPCEKTFPGGLIKTKSEDAGLMQVNSADWRQYGLTSNPFNPQRNIAAGVAILEADYARYGYLEYALEAYNSGSGGPNSPDAAYAQAVLANINAYEAGPTMAVWSTATPEPPMQGKTVSGAGVSIPMYQVASNSTTFWVLASAAAPLGAQPAYTWNPPPVTVTTKAGQVTSIPQKPQTLAGVPWAPQAARCVTAKNGTVTCTPQPPAMVAARALVPPALGMFMNPPQSNIVVPFPPATAAAPVWPGTQAWAGQYSGTGQYGPGANWGNTPALTALSDSPASATSMYVLMPGQPLPGP